MNKTIKIATTLLTIAIMLITLSTTVMADEWTDIIKDPKPVTEGGISDIAQKITSIITTIGVAVAVIVLLILGIQYMMGSTSQKAEYKKTMIPYLVGALLIFGASAITKVVIGMAQSVTTGK